MIRSSSEPRRVLPLLFVFAAGLVVGAVLLLAGQTWFPRPAANANPTAEPSVLSFVIPPTSEADVPRALVLPGGVNARETGPGSLETVRRTATPTRTASRAARTTSTATPTRTTGRIGRISNTSTPTRTTGRIGRITNTTTATPTPSRTARSGRPTRTPRPTMTPRANIPADANKLLGDALLAMQQAESYYTYQVASTSYLYLGYSYSTKTTIEADVVNPDKLSMIRTDEQTAASDSTTVDTEIIRVGDDVWLRNAQTAGSWKKYALAEIGVRNLATLSDVRDFMLEVKGVTEETLDGVPAFRVRFKLDGVKLTGIRDADEQHGFTTTAGDMWIAKEGTFILQVAVGYIHVQSTSETHYKATVKYSAINEPVEIAPPQ